MKRYEFYFDFVAEVLNNEYISKGYWEKEYTPASEEQKSEIVQNKSSKLTRYAQGIAQDVEYVVLDSARTDNESCSGHECFFKRTGVRCVICKQKENG